MLVSLSTKKFETKPDSNQLKNLTYQTVNIHPMILLDKIMYGYCFQAHYDYTGEFKFIGHGAKTEHFIGSSVIAIDIDHCSQSMREFVENLEWFPTFSYETFSNSENDYCFRLVYCFDEEIKSKELYKEIYLNICKENKIEEYYDKHAADAFHYFNGTTLHADTIYNGKQYSIASFSSNSDNNINANETFSEEENESTANNINANETFNPELIEDYKKMGAKGVYEKYKSVYRLKDRSNLPKVSDDTPYIELGNDHYEIKRIWRKDENGHSHIIRLKNGMNRKFKLFYNLCIRRLIIPDLTLDELLYALAYEMLFFVDNTVDKITLSQLMSIAYNAFHADLNEFNYQRQRNSQVNYKYCIKYGISKRKVAALKGHATQSKFKKNKKEVFFEYYDCDKTIKENIEYISDLTGIEFKLSTVKRWKNEEGITRMYNKTEKSSTIEALPIDNNINANETFVEETIEETVNTVNEEINNNSENTVKTVTFELVNADYNEMEYCTIDEAKDLQRALNEGNSIPFNKFVSMSIMLNDNYKKVANW